MHISSTGASKSLQAKGGEGALGSVRALHRLDERDVIDRLIRHSGITEADREAIGKEAVKLIKAIRSDSKPGLMEMFLAEYGLSTNEGIALMCLAEALLRVPDPGTMNALIEDKIAPYDWDDHLGKSQSTIVNASTIGLMLTGRVLDDDNSASVLGLLNRTVKRLGEPVVRIAVKQAMKEMGDQFVLGQTIEEAMERGAAEQKKGYLYSYDMLGEAALTVSEAEEYFQAYAKSIKAIGSGGPYEAIQDAPGVSVKLSALHPRFEFSQMDRLYDELVPQLIQLALMAKDHGIGLNVDAEEADRLEVTLKVVQAALSDERLAGWDGFGLVIQAYGKRASVVIDWLYDLAVTLDRKVMVRLVKGAYWDTEIKQAQIDGVEDFPVFTHRVATDVSYICCAKKLLSMTDRIYPQFATHNAQTAAAVMHLDPGRKDYEFQRLHGMGESLHNLLLKEHDMRCRIYAPVGPHKDLLAYLVRRLLENGANSSFVNQIVDPRLSPEAIAADPFSRIDGQLDRPVPGLKLPYALYHPERDASRGWDLGNASDVMDFDRARHDFAAHNWRAGPLAVTPSDSEDVQDITNPADPKDVVGQVTMARSADVEAAFADATPWAGVGSETRAQVLVNAASLFEEYYGEVFALLAREAGKTQADAVAELREAVDFLRYYAAQAEPPPSTDVLGTVVCISPWNFPLAIFTGQVAAALIAGNAVIAKPAEATPLIAHLAVRLLHKAGVPLSALQFLPGEGRSIGQDLSADARVAGLCFTGSTATAQAIHKSLADHARPAVPLIAETGGLNAGVIDSTALPEQAVRDVVISAFQSAGQRCSALRILYIQEDVFETYVEMISGAMDQLSLGNPWDLATDVGPVISEAARSDMQSYVDAAEQDGRLIKQLDAPDSGWFLGPALIRVNGIEDLDREVFGPVLHVAPFKADAFDEVIDNINAKGFGLTCGLHTRIDNRIEGLISRLRVGNLYVNRNQVGAIVGTQPFGGEGLSGTGPKAGGPLYVSRFRKQLKATAEPTEKALEPTLSSDQVQTLLDEVPEPLAEPLSIEDMPGPTGELNRLFTFPRGKVLCLGPTLQQALLQAGAARRVGSIPVIIVPGYTGPLGLEGVLNLADLEHLTGFSGVALASAENTMRKARQALAKREGMIIPLLDSEAAESAFVLERHLCVNTSAAGGNAALLSAVEA